MQLINLINFPCQLVHLKSVMYMYFIWVVWVKSFLVPVNVFVSEIIVYEISCMPDTVGRCLRVGLLPSRVGTDWVYYPTHRDAFFA